MPLAEDCTTDADENCDASSSCEWVTTLGGQGPQAIYGAAARPTGGIVVVGRSEGDLVWNEGSVPSAGKGAFVAAIDANGHVEWAEAFPVISTNGWSVGVGVAVAATGEIAVVGTYQSILTVGTKTLPASTGPGSGFVATLEPDGTPIDALGLGGEDMGAQTVVFDPEGGLVVSGRLKGTVDWGGGPLVSQADDVFVLRLQPDLGYESATLYGGPSLDRGSAAISPNGDLAVAGGFSSTMDLGDGVHSATGGEDMFAGLFDPEGHLISSRFDGVEQVDYASAIVADPSGGFTMTALSGGEGLTATDFGGAASPVEGNLFVVHFDASLQAISATGMTVGPDLSPELSAPARSDAGYLYVGGAGTGTLTAGATSLDLGSDPADHNAFVVKIDPSGAVVWARRLTFAEGNQSFASTTIVVGTSGEVYAVGGFQSQLEAPNGVVSSNGFGDGFVIRLDP